MGTLSLAPPQFPGFSLWSMRPTGDGGNDVSMIQESDCGVGVEGKVSAGVGRGGGCLLPSSRYEGVGSSCWAGSCSAPPAGASFSLKTQL